MECFTRAIHLESPQSLPEMQAPTSPQSFRLGFCVPGKNALKLAVLGLAALFAAVTSSSGASWKPILQTNLGGYEVSYGTVSGKYTNTIDVGLKTEAVIPNLKEGVTYYAVVRPYTKRGVRGRASAEIRYQRPVTITNSAPNGVITSPSTSGTIVAGQTVDFSGIGSDRQGGPFTYRWAFGRTSGIPSMAVADPPPIRFNIPGTYVVSFTVTDSMGLADPIPDTRTITVLPSWSEIARVGWSLKYVNSEEPDGFAATQSFDGDPQTFWHTKWRAANAPPPPHQIQIDLGKPRLVKGFEYLPRQDEFLVGAIGKYEFYVSKNGVNWGKPVAAGAFTSSKTEKRVFCTPKTGRYIRLVSLTEANGARDCAVAELNVLEGPPANRAPKAQRRTYKTPKNKACAVVLKGSDADRNPLTFQILAQPKHGKLSGIPPNLTYQPDRKFTGTDQFTYRISDGQTASRVATVQIKVGSTKSSKKSAPMIAGGRSSALPDSANPTLSLPGAPSPASRRQPQIGQEWIDGLKFLTLSVEKSSLPAGSKPRVEVSSNLVDWFSGRTHTTTLTDNETFLKVRDNTPLVPGRKRYIRLKSNRP